MQCHTVVAVTKQPSSKWSSPKLTLAAVAESGRVSCKRSLGAGGVTRSHFTANLAQTSRFVTPVRRRGCHQKEAFMIHPGYNVTSKRLPLLLPAYSVPTLPQSKTWVSGADHTDRSQFSSSLFKFFRLRLNGCTYVFERPFYFCWLKYFLLTILLLWRYSKSFSLVSMLLLLLMITVLQ